MLKTYYSKYNSRKFFHTKILRKIYKKRNGINEYKTVVNKSQTMSHEPSGRVGGSRSAARGGIPLSLTVRLRFFGSGQRPLVKLLAYRQKKARSRRALVSWLVSQLVSNFYKQLIVT